MSKKELLDAMSGGGSGTKVTQGWTGPGAAFSSAFNSAYTTGRLYEFNREQERKAKAQEIETDLEKARREKQVVLSKPMADLYNNFMGGLRPGSPQTFEAGQTYDERELKMAGDIMKQSAGIRKSEIGANVRRQALDQAAAKRNATDQDRATAARALELGRTLRKYSDYYALGMLPDDQKAQYKRVAEEYYKALQVPGVQEIISDVDQQTGEDLASPASWLGFLGLGGGTPAPAPAPAAAPPAGSPGGAPAGQFMDVRLKETGQIGTIPVYEFDPAIYERI